MPKALLECYLVFRGNHLMLAAQSSWSQCNVWRPVYGIFFFPFNFSQVKLSFTLIGSRFSLIWWVKKAFESLLCGCLGSSLHCVVSVRILHSKELCSAWHIWWRMALSSQLKLLYMLQTHTNIFATLSEPWQIINIRHVGFTLTAEPSWRAHSTNAHVAVLINTTDNKFFN